MKIALFIQSLNGGGAERVTSQLANAWAAMDRDVTVITLSGIEGDTYELQPNIRRVGLDLASESSGIIAAISANIRRVFALRKLIKQLDVDVVVGQMTTASVLAVLAAIGLKSKVVVVEHIYPPMLPVGCFWSILRRIVYRWSSVAVALTEESREWLLEVCSCSRVAVIPNPVVWPLNSNGLRIPVDEVVSNDRCIILATGRLNTQKGFDMLLGAFAGVSRKAPGWDLVILGEGPLRKELEEQRNSLGLAGRVFMPGYTGNVADWYERADIYVMSSRFEGFPCALLEAMASGCPAVSFDCDTGPRDIIRHGVDGLLIKPGDIESLSEAMLVLMTNGEQRKQFATKALDARERFSLPHILSLWEEVILLLGKEGIAS